MDATGTKATILVVEDDVHLLEGIRDILQLDDYQVWTAQNGVQALNTLRTQAEPPDLIVSDIMMPEMDGIEFFKKVRQEARWLRVPFIFLTAKGEKSDYYSGLRMGVDDYIIKPYDPADLLEKINSKLHRQRALDAAHSDSLSALKRQILTILNHEFRTPLTFVVAYADMLNDPDATKLSEKEMLTYLKGVSAGADRLRSLIENFILLVEMETGDARQTYEWRKCAIEDITTVFRAARDRVKAFHDGSSSLAIQVEPGLPILYGDPEYLAVALGHLLSNAVKFSEPGTQVTLAARVSDSHMHLSVSDEGRGIPPEEQEHIWDSFYQINRATYEDQGAGAGLAIVRGVAGLHGGRVEVQSEVGVGSRFSMVLPIEKPVV